MIFMDDKVASDAQDIRKIIQEEMAKNRKEDILDKTINKILGPEDEKELKISKPKIQKKPLYQKGMRKYPIYLILPKQETAHTFITEFVGDDGRVWWYLDFDNKVYPPENVEIPDTLSIYSCNFIFLENGKLKIGDVAFSREAQAQIDEVDKMKIEDRTYEKSNARMNRKYRKVDGLNIIIAILLLCVGVFLVLWVMFGGLPNVIGAINAVNVAPAAPLANQTIVVGG